MTQDAKALASAPAGDGVERAAREAVVLLDEINAAPSSRNFYGIGPGTTGKLATIRATLAAALARPRAAVGERDGPVSVDDAIAFADLIAERHRLRANEAEARIKVAMDCLIQPGEGWQEYALRLRLALQSPLAKVEPNTLALVIAAREFWDMHNDLSPESKALDTALEPFASPVPYANEPTVDATTPD